MHSKGKTKETSKSVSVKAGRRKKVTSITDVLLFFFSFFMECLLFFFLFFRNVLSRNTLVDLE